MLRLARRRYAETNNTHLSGLLSERESIDIARTTLRHILADPMATATAIDLVVHHSVILEFDHPATESKRHNSEVRNRR